MNNEREPYSPIFGDYDTKKLTDLHSQNTESSHYLRNIQYTTDTSKSSNSYNSSDRSIKKENHKDTTERIPTLSKYSTEMNKEDDNIEYKGKI